jgi:hypothetical protein
MTTFKGAVVGADPARTGPRGRARCRKESDSAMIAGGKDAGMMDRGRDETLSRSVVLLLACLRVEISF